MVTRRGFKSVGAKTVIVAVDILVCTWGVAEAHAAAAGACRLQHVVSENADIKRVHACIQ